MVVQSSVSTNSQLGVAGQIDQTFESRNVISRVCALALTTGLLACLTSGASTVRHLAPVASSPTAFVATGGASTAAPQTVSGAALNGATGQGTLRQARTVTLVLSSSTDWDATTAVLTGKGVDGQTIVENLSIPNNGNATVTSTNLFTSVTSLVIPAQTGTGGTFTLGTGDALGPIDACAAGVVAFSPSRSSLTYSAGEVASLVRQGRVWVSSEDAVSEGGPVYVRMTATGDESVGALRGTPDSTDCALLRGARWASTTSAAGLALVELNLP
jgi:hypothetical protein